jgi:hypothetical protein
MFPLGNIRQPLIADDLYQFVRGVSVEGEVAPDHRSPFTVLQGRLQPQAMFSIWSAILAS